MYNCHKDITEFHDKKINLTSSQINELKGKRDANRDKLKKGLASNSKPSFDLIKSQGSYAMRTMVQSPNNDYDIDDGVYFKSSLLAGKSALDTRHMVCDAVQDDKLNTPPCVRNHCVRIEYNDGSHIDIPAYKTDDGGENPELASTDWVRSDARDVTKWFRDENKSKSPDKDSAGNLANSGQLRRITRLLKAFARSRDSWKGSILSGFGITVLVCECYQPDPDRDDVALYYSVKEICARLHSSLKIDHPVTNGAVISKSDDARATKFRDELCEKLNYLNRLLESDCTCEEAMECWKKFFKDSFFDGRCEDEKPKVFASSTPSAATTVKRGGTGGYA